MSDYTALAFVVPRGPAMLPPELIARAPTLPALAEQVRMLAPGATLRVHEAPVPIHCDGRPICGTAREPTRIIYLCASASDATALSARRSSAPPGSRAR